MSGLVLAGTMGCVLFIPGVLLARFIIEWQKSWWIGIDLAVALLMQLVMVVAAVGALRSMKIVRSDWIKISGSLANGTVLFILFWLAYSPVPRKTIGNEMYAKDQLREISWNNAVQYEMQSLAYPDTSSPHLGKVECDYNHL